MALGGTYNTGLVFVTNGSKIVQGVGVLWLDVIEGDWIQIGGVVAVVDSVDDTNTIITLKDPWAGATSPSVLISFASPAVVTLNNHGFAAGQQVAWATGGSLPGGLTASVLYFVIAAGLGTNNFEVSATLNGSALNTTGSGSGAIMQAQSYRVLKMSWLRYDASLTQAKLREFLLDVEAAGLFLFVSGSAPDPSTGEDGQYALKTNGGVWKLWYNTGGEWVLQGSPVGFNWTGPWDSITSYNNGDGVSRLGSSYISLAPDNNDNPPETTPSFWGLFATGGDRYDVACWASDRPASGETVLQLVLTTTVTFQAGLGTSVAVAGTVPTATAVFSLLKNGVQFGTVTFPTGVGAGTFAAASLTTFNSGDVLSITTPNPRDATLANISITISGSR